ncbi:polysaccharide deacetylase family protein [Planotetraspora sp. A-T 1434]|uniref:polysaccharide deacetylase family protein n=1 Tax=Planotetraspora sp. A-T 1434 TaxID=2979219 RepID=UPI0021C0EB3A|nr:polysaccharide deacetylase family protein [Planotetraspora sp. A-T 1434]MCT9930949.1 polysaccharide deacetylase family protein [Planotetraspora sp. A-T 1434]
MERRSMLYSGIAWTSNGYEIEVVGEDGRHATPPVRFGAGQQREMIAYLQGIAKPSGQSLVTVVESTNGVLDGGMMVSGLDVYRADPWVLPERPLFGSVTAHALAQAARQDLSALARLQIDGGTLTGRIDELDAGIARSAAAEDALTRAGRCLRHGGRERADIALTFDDGPNPPYTGQILDILERYGVPATFFCVGLHASARPGDIARIADMGHAVGNHTWSHPFLPDLSRPQLGEQIERTEEVLVNAGGAVSRLFRPPYGSRTPEVMDWLSAQDVTVVLWDVEPFDWALPGPGVITEKVLAQARPGSIVLMHDGGGDRSQTVAALPGVIEGLLDRGYRFVLVDELLSPHQTA